MVQVNEVADAAVTVHEPDEPMMTVFRLAVVLKPVPVIVTVELTCETPVTVGVCDDNH